MTPKRARVLVFLVRYWKQHGFAPTLQEIAQHLGIVTASTAMKHIDILEAQGYVSRSEGQWAKRSLVATPRGETYVERYGPEIDEMTA